MFKNYLKRNIKSFIKKKIVKLNFMTCKIHFLMIVLKLNMDIPTGQIQKILKDLLKKLLNLKLNKITNFYLISNIS